MPHSQRCWFATIKTGSFLPFAVISCVQPSRLGLAFMPLLTRLDPASSEGSCFELCSFYRLQDAPQFVWPSALHRSQLFLPRACSNFSLPAESTASLGLAISGGKRQNLEGRPDELKWRWSLFERGLSAACSCPWRKSSVGLDCQEKFSEWKVQLEGCDRLWRLGWEKRQLEDCENCWAVVQNLSPTFFN